MDQTIVIDLLLVTIAIFNTFIFFNLSIMAYRLYKLHKIENGISLLMSLERAGLAMAWLWNIYVSVAYTSFFGVVTSASIGRLFGLFSRLAICAFLSIVMYRLNQKMDSENEAS